MITNDYFQVKSSKNSGTPLEKLLIFREGKGGSLGGVIQAVFPPTSQFLFAKDWSPRSKSASKWVPEWQTTTQSK